MSVVGAATDQPTAELRTMYELARHLVASFYRLHELRRGLDLIGREIGLHQRCGDGRTQAVAGSGTED
jgi:hypothetical protein